MNVFIAVVVVVIINIIMYHAYAQNPDGWAYYLPSSLLDPEVSDNEPCCCVSPTRPVIVL